MKKLCLFLGFLLLVAFFAAPVSLYAAEAPPAQPALQLTPLANQLGQTLQTLVGASTQQLESNKDEDNLGQISDTFATGILNALAKTVGALKVNGTNLAADMTVWPDFMSWLTAQTLDAHSRLFWAGIGNDLVFIVGVPLLGAFALVLLLLPVRSNLRRHRPKGMPGRVGLLLGLLGLRLLPAVTFLAGALFLLDQNETHKLSRFLILNVIYAISMAYGTRQFLRAILSPMVDHLRLFALASQEAVYAFRWLSVFVFVVVYGYFFLDFAAAVRLPDNASVVFQNLIDLILILMIVIVVFHVRKPVAHIICAEDSDDTHSFVRALRGWLSRHWHSLVTSYLVIGLVITFLEIENGAALMLRGTILTFIILASERLAFVALDYWKAPRMNASTLVHRHILVFLLRPLIWVLAIGGIAAAWGLRFGKMIATPVGQKVTSAFLSIALTLFVLTVLYESASTAIDRYLGRRDKNGKTIASAQARTLLPMLRNSLFILFSSVAIVMGRSAVGFDIGPLLAGAGVVGVAIGFGSQTLVKDFLTGLFIVVENTIAVGDLVTIGGFHGHVEALSLRTIRVRDYDGSLHILPFSEVSKITNMSRGYAYALVDIGVSYDADLVHVMNVLRDVGAELQEDPIFKRVILEPIEVMGVENFGNSSITIRARIRTRPGKQVDVRRLLLLRIKQRFDKENIEIPYPVITHITRQEG